jgi:hypothetical protein
MVSIAVSTLQWSHDDIDNFRRSRTHVMRYRVSALLFATTASACGIVTGLKFGYTADAVLLLILLLLWTGTGFCLGWTTSQWPTHWPGRWILALPAALVNWSFFVFFCTASSQAYNEDTGEFQWPHDSGQLHDFLIGSGLAYWWCVAWTIVFAYAAWRGHNRLTLFGLGVSLSTWLAIGWWALARALEGYGRLG